MHLVAKQLPEYSKNDDTNWHKSVRSCQNSKCENRETLNDTVFVSNVSSIHLLPKTQNSNTQHINERLW